MNRFKYFLRDENGAAAIEYGLIVAMISMATISAMKTLGSALNTMFTTVGSSVR